MRLDPAPRPPTARLHPDDLASGWRLWNLPDGPVAVTTDVSLLNDPDTPLVDTGRTFRRPALTDGQIREFVALRFAGRNFSDGAKVSLAGLPRQPGGPVEVAAATYLDQHLTNELGSRQLRDAGRMLVDGRRLWTDTEGRLRPLGMTGCADRLGGAVLAVTSDRWVVVSRRSARPAVHPGRLDVTSSGSFDRPARYPPVVPGVRDQPAAP